MSLVTENQPDGTPTRVGLTTDPFRAGFWTIARPA